MDGYKMTIGLEIHAELKTKSKMFCGCANLSAENISFEDKTPNTNVCPICMGHPGTLPVPNKEAIRKVLLVGTAIDGELADFTEFDRKNYFYPDIPKGYQISQYKYPLIKGGKISGVELTRIHLEEDTARSSHETLGVSLVDFNRAGVPLMELVTEPVIHSSEEAVSFAKEFQLLLQYLDVSEANMEKGEMRVEVNFSISRQSLEINKTAKDDAPLGTKVEIKNINSFRAAGKAIDFEFERHKALLEKGEKIVQETRGWDENKEVTFSQRSKENAKDYRYFPDPDIPKFKISEIPEFSKKNLKKSLPELPWEKRNRLLSDGLKEETANVFVSSPKLGQFLDNSTKGETKEFILRSANYLATDVVGLQTGTGKTGNIEENSFKKLIQMSFDGSLSSRGVKDTLTVLFNEGGDPETIAKEKGLIQKSDPAELRKIMEEVISKNPESVEEYKKGKESLLQFFVGQGMKATKGAGNPEVLKSIALELLK